MTDEQIKRQIEAIKEAANEVLAAGPEACRQFLIDAGIIKRKGGMNKIHGCRNRIKRSLQHIRNYVDGINNPEAPFYEKGGGAYISLLEERKRLIKIYDELDELTGTKNERVML